jgi:hypothetical protein
MNTVGPSPKAARRYEPGLTLTCDERFFFVALPASWDLSFRAKHLLLGADRTTTGHFNRSVDGVFEIIRVVGRRRVSIA